MITFPNFPSIAGSDALVISDSNYRQYASAAPHRKSVHARHELRPELRGSTGYKGWQHPGHPHTFRGPSPVRNIIPRSEWVPMLQAGKGQAVLKALVANNIQAKDQNGLGYCWVYGSTRSVELRRVREGLAHVELAPESVGGPITGWRNEGGYASQAFDQIQTGGICEETFLDAPCSLHHNRWKAGWQANAKTHEAVDWYNLDGNEGGDIFAEVVSCLLNDAPVAAGLGWWGHLICFLCPIILADGSVGVVFQNSWGVDWPTPGANGIAVLTESRATPDGAASPTLTIDDASDDGQ